MNYNRYTDLFNKSNIVSKKEVIGYHPDNGFICGACGACGACGGHKTPATKQENGIKNEQS